MNAMALFSLHLYFIFTYFVVILYIFPKLTNYIREPKQWHRNFFSFFPCFCPVPCNATFETLFDARLYMYYKQR